MQPTGLPCCPFLFFCLFVYSSLYCYIAIMIIFAHTPPLPPPLLGTKMSLQSLKSKTCEWRRARWIPFSLAQASPRSFRIRGVIIGAHLDCCSFCCQSSTSKQAVHRLTGKWANKRHTQREKCLQSHDYSDWVLCMPSTNLDVTVEGEKGKKKGRGVQFRPELWVGCVYAYSVGCLNTTKPPCIVLSCFLHWHYLYSHQINAGIYLL